MNWSGCVYLLVCLCECMCRCVVCVRWEFASDSFVSICFDSWIIRTSIVSCTVQFIELLFLTCCFLHCKLSRIWMEKNEKRIRRIINFFHWNNNNNKACALQQLQQQLSCKQKIQTKWFDARWTFSSCIGKSENYHRV